MKKLEGKVAVVTGASSGMGREIARLFAQEGAKVFALARRKERLEELKKEAADNGQTLEIFPADVSNDDDIDKAIDAVKSTFGSVDILVNNAGLLDDFAPAATVKDEVWERVLNVNVTAPMKLMRRVLPMMLEKKSGVIINISSVGGLHGARGGAAYVTSKHALVGLTRNTGYMYASEGIRCNSICPGSVETEIASSSMGAKIGMDEAAMQKLMAGVATQPRDGASKEIATAALFLASDDSSFVNGTELVVDGGWTAF